MTYFVLIDQSSGEVGRVFTKRIQAINAVRSYNAMDYDSPQGGDGGWTSVHVEAPEGTTEKEVIKMAKAKLNQPSKTESKAISKTFYNRYLGNDEVSEHTKQISKGMSQEALDEAYNTYFQGSSDDFKKMIKTVSEAAQFTSFLIEKGIDVRLINQMLKILA